MSRVFIGIFLLVLGVGGFYLFSGDSFQKSADEESDSISQSEQLANAETSRTQEPAIKSPHELKLEKMQAKFKVLKEARKKIKMRLSRLSSRLRRVEFTPEQAKAISQDMRRGNYLLKNPKLLGAFSSVKEIELEIEQLSELNGKLDAIKQQLDKKKQEKN